MPSLCGVEPRDHDSRAAIRPRVYWRIAERSAHKGEELQLSAHLDAGSKDSKTSARDSAIPKRSDPQQCRGGPPIRLRETNVNVSSVSTDEYLNGSPLRGVFPARNRRSRAR